MAGTQALRRLPILGATHAPAGALVNVAFRLAIVVLTVDSLVNGGDQRYGGKALAPRDILITFGFAMLLPLVWKLRYRGRTWRAYPWWFDDLYLSIFLVDMVGNAFDFYNAYPLWWNHIPHTHGPGALAIVLAGAFGLSTLSAVGLATILHVLLESSELYGDILFGTHNFRGAQYEFNDLLFGLLGVALYGAVWYSSTTLRRKRAAPLRRQRR